jgi:hypothetical protein
VTTLSVRFPADGPYVLDGDRLLSSEITVTAGPTLNVVTV